MTSYYGAFSVRRRVRSWARWEDSTGKCTRLLLLLYNFHSKCCWCWWFDLILNFPPVEISTRWLVITLDGISRLCPRLDNIADVMISFQPLLINQPKAKKEKMRKTFSVESQIPPRNNLCVCDSSVYLEHFYGRHTRSLPVELLVVLGLYSHRFGDKKKDQKTFCFFPVLYLFTSNFSLCVCTTHTDKKQQECYTYTQTNDERLEEVGGGIVS